MYVSNHYPNLLSKEELETILNIRPLMSTDRFIPLCEEDFDWENDSWTLNPNTFPPSTIRYLIDNYVCYIRDASRFTKKLNAVARELETIYNCQADAHIYICKNSKLKHPFGAHFDRSSNLIVQCAGNTQFKVWSEIEDTSIKNTGLEMKTDPIIDIVLNPGDSIMIPAYFPHEAISHTPRFSVSFPMTKSREFDFTQDRNWISI